MDLGEAYDKADELLGLPGRMLSGSKDFKRYPQAVWNANVVTRNHKKLWFGDLDLGNETTRATLQKLATDLDESVYVLSEMDCRFDTEDHPRFENAKEIFDA